MNPGVTTKEAIMQVCRKLAAEQGISALHMRTVAKECHIALGTLYNYYADKNALLLATVESVWMDIIHTDAQSEAPLSFPDAVAELFDRIRIGISNYPDFLTAHSVVLANFQNGEAKSRMEHCFAHMKAGMLAALSVDPEVDAAAFSEALPREAFVDLIFDHMLLLFVQQKTDCTVLTALIRRVIYR